MNHHMIDEMMECKRPKASLRMHITEPHGTLQLNQAQNGKVDIKGLEVNHEAQTLSLFATPAHLLCLVRTRHIWHKNA